MIQILRNQKYKSNICRNWLQTGSCERGNLCHFAHGSSDLINMKFFKMISNNQKRKNLNARFHSRNYKTQMCKFFQQSGHCNNFDECTFAHGYHELRTADDNKPDAEGNDSSNSQQQFTGKVNNLNGFDQIHKVNQPNSTISTINNCSFLNQQHLYGQSLGGKVNFCQPQQQNIHQINQPINMINDASSLSLKEFEEQRTNYVNSITNCSYYDAPHINQKMSFQNVQPAQVNQQEQEGCPMKKQKTSELELDKNQEIIFKLRFICKKLKNYYQNHQEYSLKLEKVSNLLRDKKVLIASEVLNSILYRDNIPVADQDYYDSLIQITNQQYFDQSTNQDVMN